MGGMSLMHWIVLIVIVLLFFGPNKIPQIGKSIGMAIRDLKKGLEGNDSDEKETARRSAKSEEIESHDKQSAYQKKTEKDEV
jgi:sec-independent protein translocase protein TatA